MKKKLLDIGQSDLDITAARDVEWKHTVSTRDIAIIGMAVKIKDVERIEDFWEYLADGVDCIGALPETRKKDIDAFLRFMNYDIDKVRYLESAYLDEIDKFDYTFFKLSPKEASLMDPNQKLFLQTAYRAIEDAGYGGSKLPGSHTGVFVGHTGESKGYEDFVAAVGPHDGMQAMPGNIDSIIPSRISYVLDLKGPSVMVNTACSSSLVALHLACRSLRTGECSQAVVGAVKINLLPIDSGKRSEIMASDGRSRTFDDSSGGAGSGEGVIAMLLKPLDKAIKDRDHIYAVIKGSAVNQDGSSIGITAPNVLAQADVITRAWQDARIDPRTISFIEAHGTGTKLGDPIEIEGITRAFGRYTDKKRFCAVGSVKTNIGHLDNAAGLAGLLKAVLAMTYRQLPPLVHFKKPNRQIDFENSPVYVNTELIEWKTNGYPLCCGISSFGLSGTNCHVILEEAQKREESGQTALSEPQILTLSAWSLPALKELIDKYRIYLLKDRQENLRDICATANTGRGSYNYRLALLVKDKEDLKNKCDRLSRCDFSREKIDHVFYGHFRIVPSLKKGKRKHDISAEESRERSEAVKDRVNRYHRDRSFACLMEIAGLYVRGADVDWEKLYKNDKFNKVRLPTYPFERKRCWLEPKGGVASEYRRVSTASKYSKELGFTLLERCLAESMTGEIYTTTFSLDKHWLLREHKVAGYATLVGTAYLELALEIGRKLYPGAAVELKELVLISPLIVPEGRPDEAQTIVQIGPDSLEFRVASRTENNRDETGKSWLEYARGKIFPLYEYRREKYDIDRIKETCPRVYDVSAEEKELRQDGVVQTGPRWNNVKTIYAGDGVYLGYLRLAQEFIGDLDEFFLHPPLVDTAIHFAVGLEVVGQENFRRENLSSYLPFMYKKTCIYGKTPPSFYSYIKTKPAASTETLSFDIRLLDTSGQVFVVFEDYTLKKVSAYPGIRAGAGKELYHEVSWIAAEPGQSAGGTSHRRIMVLTGTDKQKEKLPEKIVEKLRRKGRKVIEVGFARKYGKIGPDCYAVTGKEEDFDRLLEDCKAAGCQPDQLIHLASLSREQGRSDTLETLEKDLDKGVLALFFLVKALVRNKEPLREIVLIAGNVTRVTGLEEEINPANAALFGLGKVVSQEYPHLKCRCIDIDKQTPVDRILAEVEGENELFRAAYRAGNRFIREFRKVDIDQLEHEDIEIKEQGVYIITGGLGGIGLELARHLAAQNKVNLVLVNRSSFPDRDTWDELLDEDKDDKLSRKIKSIRMIEGSGSKVVCLSADVGHAESMRKILDQVRQTRGPIKGIIHAAGVAGEGFLINKEEASFRQVLKPKVQGTWILDRLTREDDLDFFVMCSSLTALTGSAGQGDYTAANCYLDSFAFSRSLQGKKTLAINWTGWQETGMAKDYGTAVDGIFKSIKNAPAAGAFAEILGRKISRVCLGELNYSLAASIKDQLPLRVSPGIMQKLQAQEDKKVEKNTRGSGQVEVNLKGREDGSYTHMERIVAKTLAQALGFPEIDVYDNFYDLGGDSISALTIINNVNKELGTELTVVDIFNHPTIEELAGYIQENRSAETGSDRQITIQPVKKRSYFPLSSAQRRLFVLHQFDKGSTGYNLPDVKIIQGILDKKKLEKVFEELIKRHESLRTSFALVEDEPVQVVHEQVDFAIEHRTVNSAGTQQDSETGNIITEFVRPFDLNQAPLMRVGLLESGDGKSVVLFDIHHIVADAMSCDILFSEMMMLYRGMKLSELNIQYKDFAAWQDELLRSGKIERQKKFWLDLFKDNVPVLDLPADFPRPAIQSFAGDIVSTYVDETLTSEVKEFARQNEVTLYMILLAVYYIILHRYTGQEDIVIGSTTLGRPHADLERVVGMFINILAVRNRPTGDKPFRVFLTEVKNSALQTFQNQDYQFDELVENLDLEKDFSRNPLSDVFFSFMSFDKPTPMTGRAAAAGEGLEFLPYEGVLKKSSKADITLFCTERKVLSFSFEYCTALFRKETMLRFAAHFINIIKYVVKKPNARLAQIDFLSAAEKRELLYDFNDTAVEYPADKTIYELFEKQVEKTPDNTAVFGLVYGANVGAKHSHPEPNAKTSPLQSRQEVHLTYRELGRETGTLASLLIEKGVETEDIVGILIERSVAMVVGMFAILKAGGAYLPLSPGFPGERKSCILRDSNARLLLTGRRQKKEVEKLRSLEVEKVFIEECRGEPCVRPSGKTPSKPAACSQQPVTSPSNLAYVIYTSGSTGTPRGVAIEHRSVLNTLYALHSRCPFERSDTYLLKTTYVFDVSVTELFGWFLGAGRMAILAEGGEMNPGTILNTIAAARVTHLNFVPTMFNAFVSCLKPADKGKLATLKYIFLAGEVLMPEEIKKFKQFDNECLLENIYGPTEASIYASWYSLSDWDGRSPIPIGKPLFNNRLYILDKNFRLQPPGIPGQLLISGRGLARGYLNNPELTAEKFASGGQLFEKSWTKTSVNNKSFSGGPGGRFYKKAPLVAEGIKLYKTGDLARWLPDGNIEFLGRLDYQVKIRGFRIELGEIESHLMQHDSIKEAVVTVKEEKNRHKYLCAYIVGAKSKTPAPNSLPTSLELREYLSRTLPDYMIPTDFILLEEIPLTTSGKVDRKALDRYGTPLASGAVYTGPQNDIEKTIAAAWKKTLQLDKIGIHDNFFDLGGNSLLIIKVNNQLKNIFKQDIPLVTMFRCPTVSTLAQYLQKGEPPALTETVEQVKEPEKQLAAEAGRAPGGMDIAIIGMAGRFPGSRNITEFWENLKNGVESISFFSPSELEEAGVKPALLQNPNYIKAMGQLADVYYFDAPFFDYTPREAQVMNPQMRIFHECVLEALENAGYHPQAGSRSIGLYAGATSSFFWEGVSLLSGQYQSLGAFAADKLANRDFLCSRISYNLNLKGPSEAIQTACSTSLVAIHQACSALLAGECDIALAGGITIYAFQEQGYLYEEGLIISSDGHCRAFDARAAGTVFGSGAGIVVLKPLLQASADRDHIHAVIKGSAINNDGSRKVGYTAPSIEGQAEVIKKAQQIAAVKPETISYVETHGTGTNLGDPVEVAALELAFNTKKTGFCAIGSVKTNVGHLDSAAGVAGFIKTVLAIKHRLIPPSLNFETPNPGIDFPNSPFYVNKEPRQWKRDGYPLRAGVSSFGIGGTNAHVILEEWADDDLKTKSAPWPPEAGEPETPQLILLSARSKPALERMTENLAAHFKKNIDLNLADAAYTLQLGRGVYPFRRMVVCADVNGAVQALTGPDSKKTETNHVEKEDPQVVFMFPGQGSQYVDMGLELYESESLFRQEMDRCFGILEPLMGCDLKEILYPGFSHQPGPESRVGARPAVPREPGLLAQTEITQPVIFIVEYALAKLLMSWGLTPKTMIGHSIGEYTAACLSGVLSLEETLRLVFFRGKLMQQLPGGSMLGIPLPEAELLPLLNEHISLAAVNSSSRCVVSGSHEAVEEFARQLKEKGYDTRPLHTSHAFHSTMMEPILAEFAEKVRQVPLHRPKIPYISNLSGDWMTAADAADPAYWAAQLRNPVRFAAGVEKLLKEGPAIFVEIGPGRVLSTFVKQHKQYNKKDGQHVVNLLRHPQEDVSDNVYLRQQIGKLWLYGGDINWSVFYTQEQRYRLPLPTYPFDRHYYRESKKSLKNAADGFFKPSTGKKPDIADWFYIPIWKQGMPPARGKNHLPVPANWLVFIDECNIGPGLVEKLKQKEYSVISVKTGEKFKKEDNSTYVLNPRTGSHYRELFTQLQKQEMVPHIIVHLWGVTENCPGNREDNLEDTQAKGFYSLVYIAKAIAARQIDRQIRIKLVTTDMQDVTGEEELRPGKAAVLGPLKLIPQEYPDISCSCIDIVLPHPGKEQTGRHSPTNNQLLDRLVKELTVDNPGEVIALRGRKRWQQSYEAISLDHPGDLTPQRLKEKGVYLITGGLGNIGLLLAEYLVKTVQAKLVLLGRSAFPPEEEWDRECSLSPKIEKIKELEKAGGQVMILRADAADKEQMQAAMQRAESHFGLINGVIHAAGIVSGESSFVSLADLDEKHCREQFRSKIDGLLVLESLLQGKDLDFCILMSSLSSVLGGLGFTAYSAANIFMDAFSLRQKKKGLQHWISVNWDAWHFKKEKAHDISGTEIMAITPGEGLKAFQRILSMNDLSQVVVSTGDLQPRIDKWIKGETLKERENRPREGQQEVTAQQRPGLPDPYEAPGNEIEKKIAAVWQDLLGIEPIGIHDDFFELGGDSLLAVQAVTRLNRALDIRLSSHTLLKERTVEAVAGFIESDRKPQSSLLVEIQAGSSREKPFFLVHPVGGHVYFYRELAEALGPDQPVYGIQAQGLDGKTEPITTIEEMAAKYIDLIRAIRPEGPYYLGGSSFGGMAAFEMAQQLYARGQELGFLFMIDTPGFGHMPTELEDEAAILAYMVRTLDGKIAINAEKIRQMSPGARRDFILANAGIPGEENPDAVLEQASLFLNVFKINSRAMFTYKTRIYPGRIIFFKAAEESPYNPKDVHLAWENLAADGIEVHEVPGDHITMNYSPNVAVIAGVLKKHINKPRRGTP